LHYLELTELTRRIHAGELTSVEATQASLARIAALDGMLHSFALVLSEYALEQARIADEQIRGGQIKGPLHGAPIAVKDLCWMQGVPTAAGTIVHRDYRPAGNATVVDRLAAAGAVILGKLQLTEGAYADHHPQVVPPVNPWNAAHWSGASSSGSGSATAAGLCYGSLGSDTGGSIRFPSAASGLTGLKPTWGRVSRHGVFELAATLDHIGPMTRSARDAAAMLGVIAGADENDPTALQDRVPDYLAGIGRGLRGVRVGIAPAWTEAQADATTQQVIAAAAAVVRDLGAEICEVRFPDVTQMVADWFPLCGVETAVAHEATYPSRKSEYGPALSGLIDLGRSLSGTDHQKIILRRIKFSGEVAALFRTVDLLLLPAQGFASPTLAKMATLGEDAALMTALLSFTCPFDMSGSPTITLPCGFTDAGTPVAFQFVGAHLAEERLCQAGYAFQEATDWHKRHPALG
jgi:amidase